MAYELADRTQALHAAGIDTYTVEAFNGREAYTVELIATSEDMAVSRTRGTLTHRNRDISWLTATYEVTHINGVEVGLCGTCWNVEDECTCN